jgi:ribonuclease J
MTIEADGRRLFYSGDIRGHGRKAPVFEQLLADPPSQVDALLMEGTHVRADGSHDNIEFESEQALEDRFATLCRDTAGLVAVLGSAQNLDRVVTVYRAARRSGRQFVIDLYAASVAAATRASIPQPGFEALRVYVPNRQRILVKSAREFDRVAWVKLCRVFLEEVAEHPERFVFHVPSSTAAEIIHGTALTSVGTAVVVVVGRVPTASVGITPVPPVGRSRHRDAAPAHLRPCFGQGSTSSRRRRAASPGGADPLGGHLRYAELFANVERHVDGAWWEV